MKKVLYATTALVALGMAPVAAQAQDKRAAESPIVISVGGYFNAFAVFADQRVGGKDNNPAAATDPSHGNTIRPYGISRESEIHFKGETALNNGLRVGVQVELEGETSADQIDNTYIYFQHAQYGRLIVGEDWGAALKVAKGTVGHITGIGLISHFANQASYSNRANFTGTNPLTGGGGSAGLNTIPILDGVNDKAIYDTPRIYGFRGSFSFTPDDKASAATFPGGSAGAGNFTSAGESGQGLNPKQNGYISISDVWSLGADYIETFGPIGVAASASIQRGTRERPNSGREAPNNPTAWALGLELSYEGFRVGTAWRRIENNLIVVTAGTAAARGIDGSRAYGSASGTDTTGFPTGGYGFTGNRDDFSVGTDYTFGPWTVGATYGFVRQGNVPLRTANGNAHTSTDRNNQWTLGANYVLGPGINLYGGYLGFDTTGRCEGALQGCASNHGSVFILGTRLVF